MVAKKAHWHKGEFKPINKSKWINTNPIIYRSSWEKKLMIYLDDHPAVLKVGSECIAIDYINPFLKKKCRYFPDFYVESINKKGELVRTIYEVKPFKESNVLAGKSQHDKMSIILNYCKWRAAVKFCKDRNIKFKVLTERELFI